MKKNVKISSQSPRNNNPFYISNIKEEILITLGINYTNINNIKSFQIDKKNIKYVNYFNNFKNFIDNELDIIYNIYKTGDNNDNIIDKIQLHVNNLNEYTMFILKLINSI